MASVLCIDDDPDILDLLDGALRRRGHQVYTARRLGHATAHLSAGRAEALVVDGQLPDGDGLRWIGEVRRAGFAGPVVLFAAGLPGGATHADVRANGVGLFIDKRVADLPRALEDIHLHISGVPVIALLGS